MTPDSPLRTIRKARGMTVEQLAFHAGLASATVYRAERGLHRPTDETLDAILGVLGVSLEELRAPAAPSTPANGDGASANHATLAKLAG